MRARAALAAVLWRLGRRAEAVEHQRGDPLRYPNGFSNPQGTDARGEPEIVFHANVRCAGANSPDAEGVGHQRSRSPATQR
jgi:hypothetical protein